DQQVRQARREPQQQHGHRPPLAIDGQPPETSGWRDGRLGINHTWLRRAPPGDTDDELLADQEAATLARLAPFVQRASALRRASASSGLERWSSIPAARQAARSSAKALAVRAMIGVWSPRARRAR